MLRLFFALQPTPEQNIAITAQVAPLIVGAQPVRADNLHATLCFIGALGPQRLDGLRAVAATVHARRVELRFDSSSREAASRASSCNALSEGTITRRFSHAPCLQVRAIPLQRSPGPGARKP